MKTFGSDPEFMVEKDGEIKSAIGVVSGSKKNRITLKGHDFFYDNVMAECAIKPGKNKKQVLKHFKECFSLYAEMVAPFKLRLQASHDFPMSILDHPDALEVGCDPDWCAYKIKQMPTPKEEIKSSGFRSCGGHIHLGDKCLLTDSPDPQRAVYLADLLLGVPSLWLDDDPSSEARRSLYGQAGRYRTKEKYGLEYRSLGNFWLKSPSLVSWVYEVCEFIIEYIKSEQAERLYPCDFEAWIFGDEKSDSFTFPYDRWALQKALDASDKDASLEFLEFAKTIMPEKLFEEFESLKSHSADFYSDWQLE